MKNPDVTENPRPQEAERSSDDDESGCRKPCDPDTGCPECAGYWERMEREGYWDMKRHRWTDKGWHEITRFI